MTKTTLATDQDHKQSLEDWFVVDATNHVLGRMAARIAEVLMGKHLPRYTPHICVGAGVIVVNAGKVSVTGNKRERKIYTHYTGYPGGLRKRALGECLARNPEVLVKNAVRRMLPKNRIARHMLSRLKVYSAAVHPHIAQKPQPLTI